MLHGGEDADGDADDHGQREGPQAELDRRRQPLDQDQRDRPAVADRVAKVAAQNVAEEDPNWM